MKPEERVSKLNPVLAKDDHSRSQGEHEAMLPQLEEGKPDLLLGGTGVRLTDAQKKRIRVYCIERDGPKCVICGRDADTLHLEIDHVNGDSTNHSASNLRLAHHSCNSRAWSRSFAARKLSDQPKREREGCWHRSWTWSPLHQRSGSTMNTSHRFAGSVSTR